MTLLSLLCREAGQGMAEYALILSLVAIVAVMFLTGQGDTVLMRIGGAL